MASGRSAPIREGGRPFSGFGVGIAGSLAILLLVVAPLRAQEDRLLETLREDVARSLRELCPGEDPPEDAGERLVRRIGTGAHLLPLLAEHFLERGPGILAVAHCGRLRGVDVEDLAEALRRSGRTDRPFSEAAAGSLKALAGVRLPEVCRRWRRDSSLGLRLAAIWATPPGPAAAGDIAAVGLRSRHVEEGFLALDWLLAHPGPGVPVLLQALSGGLLESVRDQAVRELLRRGDVPAQEVVAVIVGDPILAAVALGEHLERRRWREVLAELLGRPRTRLVEAWMTRLMAVSGRRAWRAASRLILSDPGMEPFLLAVARRIGIPPGEDLPGRPLPREGLILEDADDVMRLAEHGYPVHAPFLLANVDRVPWPERTRVAAALVRFGHPGGAGILRRGLGHPRRAVRAAVVRALADLAFHGKEDLLELALRDADGGIAGMALREALRSGMEMPLDLLAPLLPRLRGAALDQALGALERLRPEASRAAVQDVLGSPGTIAADTIAWWFFRRFRAWTVDDLRWGLGHPRPEVRARAAEALGRMARDGGPPLRRRVEMLEPLARDPDVVVRVHVARAFGLLRSDFSRAALALLGRDTSPLVREEAALALGRQDPYHVIPRLRRMLRDEDAAVVNAVRIALLRQGPTDQLAALLDDLDDPLLGPRTRRALDAAAGRTCRTREEYQRVFDRIRPGWEGKRRP